MKSEYCRGDAQRAFRLFNVNIFMNKGEMQMLSKLNKMLRNKKGFTLIELIVVIAILGILAAIAIPRLSGFQDSAKGRANQSNLKTIQTAVRVYEADNGKLPTSKDDLENAKYFAGTMPAPRITTSALAATSGQVFRMKKTNGVVEIGPASDTDYIDLSAGASE